MAGSLSDYAENKLLDHLFGGGDFTRPASLYVALFSVAPNDAGGGTELSGSGYARLEVTNNPTNFPAASAGQKSNGANFLFAAASGGDWDQAVAWALFDAASGGNMITHTTLTTPVTILDGQQARFLAGEIVITAG